MRIAALHRFTMAVLATERHDDLFVSTLELDRGEVSYSVDTLEAMSDRYPGATLDWIIGEDGVAGLAKWRNIERIHELANFVVLTRRNVEGGKQESSAIGSRSEEPGRRSSSSAGAIIYACNETVAVSSTEIRRRVREGEPIEAFVDPLVARYIHHNGLYREAYT